MTVNVAKELGTRYVLKSYLGQFRKVFDDWIAKDPNVTFDLCDCRLTLQAASALFAYYGKANFVNSKNETLNMYLQENCRRARVPKIDKVDLMPKDYTVETLSEYINSLSESTVYVVHVDYRTEINTQMAFVVLLILTRPEVTIDIGNVARSIREFVEDAWMYKAEHHDAYWEVDGSNLIRRDVVDGYVSAPYRNELSEDMFRETAKCLPIEFGTEYLYETKEWEGVVDKCLKTLQKKVQRPNLIKDFIETR